MRRTRGFTLLETVVALAILALALMAIFDINSGAVSNHAYAKKLTVATLLARSKMTDLEQQLYDDGFAADDKEESGDFSREGWSQYKWRAKVIAPKTDGVSPEQLVGAIFNLPIGEGGDLGGLASMFGAGGGKDDKGGPGHAALHPTHPLPMRRSSACSMARLAGPDRGDVPRELPRRRQLRR